jgi:hypothetical protein
MRLPLHESRSFACLRAALIPLIVPLVGCTLGAGNKAAVPPPPSPAAVQPPAPDQPLSIPQTAVTLPGYQEVNPDAIPQATPPQAAASEKPEAPPTAPATRTKPRIAAGPPKPEPEDEPETPAAPAVPEQAPIQPILTGEEQKKIQDAIDVRKREIDEKLNRAKGHSSSHDQPLVERIKSFLAQCAEAEKRGDFAQADALSERALILARELESE